MLDYQIDTPRRTGALVLVLERFRSPPKAVHLIYEAGPHLPLRIRAFLDYAAPRLKTALRGLAGR